MSGNKPWQVSTPVERGEKTYWTRIGSAWPTKNGNGGFNCVLDAVPVNGKFTISPPFDENAPRGNRGGERNDAGQSDDDVNF